MRVSLVKVATTLSEKMTARTMQAGFGGVPDDELAPAPTETPVTNAAHVPQSHEVLVDQLELQ